MSSLEPNDSGSQMDGAQEVARGLVVAHGNGAVLLEPGKEVLDQVTGPVQVAVIAALVLARADWRNHHGLACLYQWLDHPGLRVIGLICNDRVRLRSLE